MLSAVLSELRKDVLFLYRARAKNRCEASEIVCVGEEARDSVLSSEKRKDRVCCVVARVRERGQEMSAVD